MCRSVRCTPRSDFEMPDMLGEQKIGFPATKQRGPIQGSKVFHKHTPNKLLGAALASIKRGKPTAVGCRLQQKHHSSPRQLLYLHT